MKGDTPSQTPPLINETNTCLLFIRPSFDGRIMVWRCPSVRTSLSPSVRPSVRSVVQNPCGQDIARTIWPRMLKLSVYT